MLMKNLLKIERILAKKYINKLCLIINKSFSSLHNIETIQTRVDKNSQVYKVKIN